MRFGGRMAPAFTPDDDDKTWITSILEAQWLTLDDGDDDLGNATPHSPHIDNGFRDPGILDLVIASSAVTNVAQPTTRALHSTRRSAREAQAVRPARSVRGSIESLRTCEVAIGPVAGVREVSSLADQQGCLPNTALNRGP